MSHRCLYPVTYVQAGATPEIGMPTHDVIIIVTNPPNRPLQPQCRSRCGSTFQPGVDAIVDASKKQLNIPKTARLLWSTRLMRS